jgi:paraquat-inducible protein B
MRRFSPTLIGAFVVVGVALAIGAVVMLGAGAFFKQTYPFVLYFPGQVDGLRVGAPVRFKGVEIGRVTKIMLQYDQPPADQHIPVFIEFDLEQVLSRGGWADFSPERVQRAIERGLRAQLQMESLLTGLLFVQMDFQPGTPAKFVGVTHPIPEIPTLPTTLEQAQVVIRRFLDKLEHLDIEGLMAKIDSTMAGIERLANSPELENALVALRQTLEGVQKLSEDLRQQMGPAMSSFTATAERAQRTLTELDATLKSTRMMIAPDSPLAYQIGKTLEELSQAARSARMLADTLERDPSVLLRGRAERSSP